MRKDEVEAVFKLAAALQRQEDLDRDGAPSPQQLEAIAAEVGLAPEYVRQAVALLASGRLRTARFGGLPQAIILEREFEGELSPDHHDALVELVRRRTGLHGDVQSTGRTQTWFAQRSHSTLRVTAVALTGKTRLRVEQQHRIFIAVAYLLIAGAAGTLAAFGTGLLTWQMSHAVWLASSVAVATFLGGIVAAHALLRRTIDRDTEALGDLLLEISTGIAPLLATPTPPGSGAV